MIELYYVEDDEDIAEAVRDYLVQAGYKVTVFSTIAAARQTMVCRLPDLVLIDWNMPDSGGDVLCQWIRSKWTELPLIFLTARGDSHDIVSGFQYGADDYVVKPFDLEVLHSRITALLRRLGPGQAKPSRLVCGHLTLDTDRKSVFCDSEEVALSLPEYELLLLLMENKGKTVTRHQLLEQVWDSNGSYVNDNTLTVTMKRLREKLNNPSCIKTIRSFGYRMEEGL